MIKRSLSFIRHINFWIILCLRITETRSNFKAIVRHTQVTKNPVLQRHLRVAAAHTLPGWIQLPAQISLKRPCCSMTAIASLTCHVIAAAYEKYCILNSLTKSNEYLLLSGCALLPDKDNNSKL